MIPTVMSTYPPPIVSVVPQLVQMIASSCNLAVQLAGSENQPAGNNFKYTLPNSTQSGNALLVAGSWPSSVAAPTISDNINGTWPAAAIVITGASGAQSVGFYLRTNIAPGVTTIEATFSGAVKPFQWDIFEWANITGSNGSVGATYQPGPNLACGPFTPGNNNVNGGNLIVSYFSNWEYTTSAAGPNPWVPSGATLLEADRTGVINGPVGSGFNHAAQYQLQTTATAINPAMTATGDTTYHYNCIAIALTVGETGAGPPAGISIAKIIHQSIVSSGGPGQNNNPATSAELQIPWTGDLRFGYYSLTTPAFGGITDSGGYTWTNEAAASGNAFFGYAQNTAADANATLTFNSSGGFVPGTFRFYDIMNAATPIAFDNFAVEAGPSNLTGITVITDCPTITPITSTGLAIAAIGLDNGPGLTVTSPSGAIFDYISYTGEIDFENYDNADCGAHYYFNSNAGIDFSWTITSTNPNSAGNGYAITFATTGASPPPGAPYLDANGWTVFPGTAPISNGYNASNSGTNIIYCSSSTGNDSNPGTIAAPVQTIAQMLSLMRAGYPDWGLLKRGDTWVNQYIGTPLLYGQSAAAPMVFGSYDPSQPGVVNPYVNSPRPIVEAPANTGVGLGSYRNDGRGNYWAIIGIDFYNYTADPNNVNFSAPTTLTYGTQFLNAINYLLIEDCAFGFWGINIDIDSSLQPSNSPGPITVRRNVITDAYCNIGQHSQGLFVNSLNNCTVEENILDHNGWNETVSGAGTTIFNHNMYATAQMGTMTYTGNIDSNTADGTQVRAGGTVTNNAFICDPYGHNIGTAYSGVPATISNNVHIQGLTNTDNGGSATPYETIATLTSPYDGQNLNLSPITISNNLITHGTPTSQGGILINSNFSGCVISNNIVCDWTTPLIDDLDSSTVTGNYQYAADANHGGFTDPNRHVGGFYSTIAGATPNATFTGAIVAGVLTVTSISGTLNQYDAITWSGQTTSDFIQSFGTGSGGIGTYNLAGTESVGSIAMKSYTTGQFIAACRLQVKPTWNTNLTATAFNAYMFAGFTT